MALAFDFDSVTLIEFGVGRDEADGQEFSIVPVDGSVQAALRDMAEGTLEAMQRLTAQPPEYEPSEKYASTEYVVTPLTRDLSRALRQLHEAVNPPTSAAALADPRDVFCYFARMTDGQGQRVTGVRRATQFKGVLKNRLLRFLTDALTMIEENVFKLDHDFDLLVDDATVHILRPSGFEFLGQLQEAVLAAAPTNIRAIRRDMPFVDFAGIEEYATDHPRAARYLASIHAQRGARNVDRRALKAWCQRTGVQIREANGTITVEKDQVMGFLEVLDRRRYQVRLVKGSPESFRAGSRQRLGA